jgi:hypothetical protein
MTNLQLFLNDKPVDLSDDSPIALTFQINDLAEVKNQQGNTSNQFKLPLTQNNRAILGFADDISIQSTTPYTTLQAKIIQNGIEILPNAIAEINEVDDNTASITVLSGNVDFFDALGGQIADMGDSTSQWSNYGSNLPWKPFDHRWNLDNVANSQKNTEQDGWIYPLVDYGLIDPVDFTQPIDVRNQRPGFFIKKAIDLMVQSTGYTAKGSLLADPLYPLLIAQFSNGSFEHGIDYQNQPNEKGILVSNAIAQTQNHPAGNTGSAQYPQQGIIRFDNVISDPSSFFKNNAYIPNEVISVEATVTIPKLLLHGHPNATYGSNLNINILLLDRNANVNLGSFNFNFSSGYDTRTGSGDSIRVNKTFTNSKLSISTTLSPTTFEGLQVTFDFEGYTDAYFTLYEGAIFQVVPQNTNVQFGQIVQCERILPDMSQKDFLKDTFQRFGVICQTDVYTKTITFSSLKDIVNNIPVANDWSSKCIDQGKQINYQLGNYAQVNNMEYQTDANLLPLKFGWDQLTIYDQTLSAVPTDLIVSKFGPSFNRPYIGGTIAQITMIDDTSAPATGPADFTIGVAPRILVDQKLDLLALGKTVTFIDGTNTPIQINDVISVPYFYKPDGDYNLCWCDMPGNSTNQKLPGLKNKYYTELQKILQNTKIIVRYFMLTPRDIAGLDLLIPIYLAQHNAYFYINKIDSWRKGQPCKIELVKLG